MVENNNRVDNINEKLSTSIFSFFYFVQGFIDGIPMVLMPAYLIILFTKGGYDGALWILIIGLSNLPWSFKFLAGILSDKWNFGKFGSRFPWIFLFGVYGSIWWFIMAFFLPSNESVYLFLFICFLMIQFGEACADTNLDSLILDVTPKEKLGKIQSYTLSMKFIGGGIGAMILGRLFLDNIEILFILTGILMLISSTLPFLVKEIPRKVEINIIKEVKNILTHVKGYKVMFFTFISSIVGQIIVTFFGYFILISADVISISGTFISLMEDETKTAYLDFFTLFTILSGVGTMVGSLMMGIFADKGRKRAIQLTYSIYIPICLMSNILFGLLFGCAGLFIFGIAEGFLTVIGQTIRGDAANKNFPDSKSTYYALLISFVNLGFAAGRILSAFLLNTMSLLFDNYSIIYLIVTLLCSGFLVLSYFVFKKIDPEDYEFEKLLKNEKGKEVYFG
ncbi:MAG: MFS transporter [archaeon]|nr:MFS transporter [archaeon]